MCLRRKNRRLGRFQPLLTAAISIRESSAHRPSHLKSITGPLLSRVRPFAQVALGACNLVLGLAGLSRNRSWSHRPGMDSSCELNCTLF